MKNIFETTVTGGYPDDGSTGPASDDDLPTGTTVFGDKMVPEKVPNRLTGSTIRYVPADEKGEKWNYDEFEHSMSMGSDDSYSDTLDSLKGILGDRLWKHTSGKRHELSPDKEDAFKDSEVDQEEKLSNDDEETMDITEKIGSWIGEVEVINEEVLSSSDRKALSKAILMSKNKQLKLKSIKSEVSIKDYDDVIIVSYKPNDDLTMSLIDISDSLGMEFSKKKDGNKTAFVIEK